MTREDFIARNPIVQVLEGHQVKLNGTGKQLMAKCLFHEDSKASMSVNTVKGVYFCHSCHQRGTVIDILAKFEGISPIDFMIKHDIGPNGKLLPPPPIAESRIESIYSYEDALGNERFQVVRYDPKAFRQRKPDGKGGYVWSMEGVERCLYRLPELLRATVVMLVEGEKDVMNLVQLGFCATCNPGGAGKWLDAYTDSLAGKEVIICGDNDEAGRKHVDLVFQSIAGKVNSAKLIKVPEPHKDASDWIKAGATKEDFQKLIDSATPFLKGIRCPIFTMREIESQYAQSVQSFQGTCLKLGDWLPSLRRLRPIVPGEMMLVIGGPGVGKTAWMQNLALHCGNLPVLLFELEVPNTLLFERFVAMHIGSPCDIVEREYLGQDRLGSNLDKHFPKLFICDEAKLDLESLEKYIRQSELKIGEKPKVVMIDYIQILQGKGNTRYEKTSDNAEGLKVMAKSCGVILIVGSQISRPTQDNPQIGLHSGKDSGALENSAGIVIGLWRDKDDQKLLHTKVLKATRGGAGIQFPCNLDPETMRITERHVPVIEQQDIPTKYERQQERWYQQDR